MSFISRFKKRKNEIKYSALILVFIIFIFTITITFLEVNLKEQGRSDIRNNYYDINMINATIDFETTSKIKLDNDNSNIKVLINDLKKYIKDNSFSLELYNIGNMDAEVNEILITNIDTNVNIDKVKIDLSLNKGTVIKASEKKKLDIIVRYDENKPGVDDYYNFNIEVTYKEAKSNTTKK